MVVIVALQRLWAGEVPLGRAFWDYGLIGGTVLNAALSLSGMALLTVDGWEAVALVMFFLAVPYNLLIAVAVWRSASTYPGRRLWADCARFAIVIWAIIASVL